MIRKFISTLFISLLPCIAIAATGDLETFIGKTDTALTTVVGKTGTGVATVLGKNYTDGDGASLWDGASPMEDSHCVGAWFMNGGSTSDETDRSGSSETLTRYGDVTQSANVPSGYSGYSRYTTATDGLEHVNGGSCDLSGAGSWTFGIWLRFISDNSADNAVWDNYYATGDQRGLRIRFDDSDDNFAVIVSAAGTAVSGTCNGTAGRATLGTTDFFHLFVVYNGSTIKIYINNVEDGTLDYSSGIFNNNCSYGLFNYPNETHSNTWPGYGDEAIWFNIALSEAQRADIITNGISGNKGASD